MSTATYVTQPTIIRIPLLLEEVRDGTIKVPRFQRPPVWVQSQRIALLESIHQGIPIGSLLIWRTRKYANKLQVYPLGPTGEDQADSGDAQQYVLDGHQRLTTLFMILGWGLVPEEKRPSIAERANDTFYGEVGPIYYDLEQESFEGQRGRKAPPDWWLPLDELFDDFALYELISEKLGKLPNSRVLINRARRLHKTFYDFQVAMVPVSTDNLSAAITSFERANTAGTKMSEAHMVSALVYTSNLDVNDELTSILEDLEGWTELESKYVLAVCKAALDIDLFNSQTDRLTKALKDDHGLLERTRDALHLATEFLGDVCNIWGPDTLPYSYQLVLVADVLSGADDPTDSELRARLERWLWVTTYVEYFASISSTRLRATLNHLRDYAFQDHFATLGEMLPARYSSSEVLPPKRFDFRGARSRALALMVAKEFSTKDDPSRLLAAAGTRAMTKLLPLRAFYEGYMLDRNDPSEDVENRFIVYYTGNPSEGFENRFISDPQRANNDRRRIRAARRPDTKFLLRHGIDEQAAEHLRANDLDKFLRRRRVFFLAKEKQFVESLGLTYIEDEP